MAIHEGEDCPDRLHEGRGEIDRRAVRFGRPGPQPDLDHRAPGRQRFRREPDLEPWPLPPRIGTAPVEAAFEEGAGYGQASGGELRDAPTVEGPGERDQQVR